MRRRAGPADPIAVEADDTLLDTATLAQEIDAFAAQLREQQVRVLATLLDNGVAWIVADLAAARAGVVHVPLPLFFTPQQIQHALQAAGVDALLTTPAAARAWSAEDPSACLVSGEVLALLRLPAQAVTMPPGTAKVTFTSGTTGTPKGVCLRAASLQAVADGLARTLQPLGIRRHLCALPFAVLLENIAGVLAPLAAGATCIVQPLARLGLQGSSGFDPGRFHAAVLMARPHSIILLPQMLAAWTAWLERADTRAPDGLVFVAVGGAAVGERLVRAARARGIPAYEGYGLSEGASVQTLNLPGADQPGSAGRTLPHARLRLAADGEIEVAGSLFAGYLGSDTAPSDWWPTGDLGHIDAQGFLQVAGRKKNVLVTSYGRNVSPEWVETALCEESAIAMAAVFGDGQPQLEAVLWPAAPHTTQGQLQHAVEQANRRLPDYARIARWVPALAAFSAAAGTATPNGRPQRAAIHRLHTTALRGAPAHLSTTECP